MISDEKILNYYLCRGGYVFVRFSVSVCVQNISKSYEQILMKFCGMAQGGIN